MPALQQPTDGLSAQVTNSLRQADPRLARISVEVEETSVKLTGTVPTYYLRALAIAATNSVRGVGLINDQIAVPVGG